MSNISLENDILKLQTIEVDRYEPHEDGIHVRHVGMIKAREAFDILEKHLGEMNLLPDEYFLFSHFLDVNAELPEYSQAVCNTNWGGNEGIYIDISLESYGLDKTESFHFATGKTLGRSGEDFLHMSRIAAECSMMLNGRGSIVRMPKNAYDIDFDEKEKPNSLADKIKAAEDKKPAVNVSLKEKSPEL